MTAEYLWIEGIIGCGKTTFVNELKTKFGYETFEEPVDLELLGFFYKDMHRWSFPMQMRFLMRRYALQKKAAFTATLGQKVAVDRGLPGDRVFAKMLVKSGHMGQKEWEIYEEAYDIMTCSLIPPTKMIFLDVEPEIALERVQKRDRIQEKDDLLPIKYLIDLRRNYYDLLSEINAGNSAWSRGITVYRVPWNVDRQSVGEVLKAIKSE